jgi:hypothetical protein
MLRLLWSLDLSHRKTRPVHPQADAKAQETIASVSSPVITSATPVSRAGHTAPMIQAERWPRSRRPRGVWPRCHQT